MSYIVDGFPDFYFSTTHTQIRSPNFFPALWTEALRFNSSARFCALETRGYSASIRIFHAPAHAPRLFRREPVHYARRNQEGWTMRHRHVRSNLPTSDECISFRNKAGLPALKLKQDLVLHVKYAACASKLRCQHIFFHFDQAK